MSAMNAHDTPSGTRMMWNASVNAICARAHGTGFTAMSGVSTAPTCDRIAVSLVTRREYAHRPVGHLGALRPPSWAKLWESTGDHGRGVLLMATTSEQPAAPPADVDPLSMVRSRSYVQALVLAAAIGVPVSAIAYGFLAL